MNELIKENLSLLNKKEYFKVKIIIFVNILVMILEVSVAGLIYPLMQLLLNPENNIISDYIIDLDFINFLNNEYSSHIILVLFIITIYFLKTCIFSFNVFYTNRITAEITTRLSNKMYKDLLNAKWTTISKKNIPTILRNVNAECINYSFKNVNLIINLISDLFLILGLTLFLIYIESTISIIALFFLTIIGTIIGLISKKYNLRFGKIRVKQSKIINKHLIQTFRALRNIIILNKKNYFIDFFNKNFYLDIRARTNQSIIQQLPKGILEILGILMIVFLIILLFFFEKSFENSVSYIGVFFICMIRLLPSTYRILYGIQGLRFGQITLKILKDEFLDLYKNHDLDVSKNKINFNEKFNSLEFKNVDFSYIKEKLVLKNINFKIKKNQIIGISGQSGKGKSTLLDLITGFIKQDKGEILVNSKNLNQFEKLTNWQNKISFVFQETYLLDESLEKNISFEDESNQINKKRVKSAIEDSQLDKFVESLDDGLNSYFGDIEQTLSGGQKQRIGLARALYNEPEILILDEATSSLDINTEEKILQTLIRLKNKCTIIIVSHKNNTLKICDQIIEL